MPRLRLSRRVAEYGDLYTNREAWLATRTSAVGWLGVARARREALTTAYHLALCDETLGLGEALAMATETLSRMSLRHKDSLMPDYTYLQAAQPTTFGHYLQSFAWPMLRDLDRLHGLYDRVDQCPAGIGSSNGSVTAQNRRGLADRLGFRRPGSTCARRHVASRPRARGIRRRDDRGGQSRSPRRGSHDLRFRRIRLRQARRPSCPGKQDHAAKAESLCSGLYQSDGQSTDRRAGRDGGRGADAVGPNGQPPLCIRGGAGRPALGWRGGALDRRVRREPTLRRDPRPCRPERSFGLRH